MIQLLITNNVEGSKAVKFTVTKKEAEVISDRYQYAGGFKRFEMDTYDDKAEGPSQIAAFVNWFFKLNR